MKKFFIFGFLIATACAFFSCEEEECDQSLRNDAGFGFYTFDEGAETDAAIDTTLSIYAETRPDSLLYDSLANRRNARLPLDPTKDSSHFIFVIGPFNDTVKIKYTRELNLISQSCGFITEFLIEEATASHHLIDSIKVTNKRITQNEDEEHFKIYFPPPDNTGN
ncbi:MAG: DUF6452 family protein [Bacteroidales bacterium]